MTDFHGDIYERLGETNAQKNVKKKIFMDYYVSQYLNIYPSHRGNSILFHGISGAIDEIDREIGKHLKIFQRKMLPIDKILETNGLKYQEISFLYQRGHLTQLSPSEEHKYFCNYVEKLHAKKMAKALSRGSLMIVPSYHCNLACPYCFQNSFRIKKDDSVTKVMTKETVDTIFKKTIYALFPHVKDIKTISIKLYGGEPFVERNRSALECIIRYTSSYQMNVSAISNASDLGKFINFFGSKTGLVNFVQISFDGDKLYHDKTRITHYGKGTFDDIIKNIHLLLKQGTRLSLRVNTQKENAPSLPFLVTRLKDEKIIGNKLVGIYGAAIHNHFNEYNSQPLFTKTVLSKVIQNNKIEIQSPLEFTKKDLKGLFQPKNVSRPMKTNFCMQNTPQSFLIDHLYEIYGCYEEAGKRHLKIGEFDDNGRVSFNERYRICQRRHVGSYEPCSKCSVALTCGGGCPIAARGTDTSAVGIFKAYCDSHRELVAKSMQGLFQEFIEPKQPNAIVQKTSSVEQFYV